MPTRRVRPNSTVMSTPRFSLVPHRGAIAVSGPDRVDFLQGLVTNDTTRVAPGHAIWAALLTPQGRFLNDMFVVDGGAATLLLETERDKAPALAKKLKMYTLRSKVVIEDRTPTVEVAVAFGADAERALDLDGATSFVDPRLGGLGVRVIAPTGRAASLLSARGIAEVSLCEYDILRVSLGVPDGSRDLQVEKALLLENGFDELNGVDWKKGCYMGQELTARTKYRALIKKRLFPVRVEGALPEPGTAVRQGDEDVGEIRSGAGGRALAMLPIEAARLGATFIAGGARIVPEIPFWMRFPERPGP